MTDAYEDWVEQYERLYRDPTLLSESDCPSCASQTLRLVFVVDAPDADQATPGFWCATCMQGIAFCRVAPPPSARVVLRGEETVPNDSLVMPGSS